MKLEGTGLYVCYGKISPSMQTVPLKEHISAFLLLRHDIECWIVELLCVIFNGISCAIL